jgi:transcriptional regulator with XRE-family HTH domain
MNGRTPFGQWLRQRRHLLDLTQAELAAQSGCSPVTIRKLEAGERKPSAELAQALAFAVRIPERERAAFIQFARSDDPDAFFQLPAWDPEQLSWRSGQLPARGPKVPVEPTGVTLQFETIGREAPRYTQVEDGRYIVQVQATGVVSGDIEGTIERRITQVIQPKPPGFDFSQAVPMQTAGTFTIRSGSDNFEGITTGSIAPMLDASGNGSARVQSTGRVICITPGFIDLFLNYVFVESTVKMVEGTGTGSRGTMRIKPSA